MNEDFKTYWRLAANPPQQKMYCIVSIRNSSVRNALYDPEAECFMSVSRQEPKPIEGVVYWIPTPIVSPFNKGGLNADLPLEIVYANLYQAHKERGVLLKELRRYIRNLHTFIEAENKSEKVHHLLNELAKAKLTSAKLHEKTEEMNNLMAAIEDAGESKQN